MEEDKFKTRARPSLTYALVALILAAIPYAFLAYLSPERANIALIAVKNWFSAIPTPLWGVLGVGHVGYTIARTIDKRNGGNNETKDN